MTANNTILSKKEATLIENLIIKHGLIVNFDQIQAEFDHSYSRQQIRNLVTKISQNGWLVRIKKGVYYITNLESRGFANASVLVIAQAILEESYISTEAALQYRGIFDQYLKVVSSVSFKKHSDREMQKVVYKFFKTSEKNFYGWEQVEIEGRIIKMATLEKAILDMIHFQRSVHSLDLILEKLKENKDNIDFRKLGEFSRKQSIVVRKILGFLLDRANIDSSFIHGLIKNAKGVSFMTKDSDIFDAKWNLYYHDHFI